MYKIETLKKTDWVSLMLMKGEDWAYIYSHENRCDGKIVSVLPYRLVNGHLEYMLRDEFTPCWGTDNNFVSSITGGVEHADPADTALEELEQEAGYSVDKSKLQFLGTCKGTKSCDTDYYLYAVDLTGIDQSIMPEGDGSELEKKAKCFWSKDIKKAMDPLVYVLFHKLHDE
jgi:8-oxo-dGTP pyrophosphatase MutT (NUDIX family)